MIQVNKNGNLEFNTKQDLIDYVLSDDCDFEKISSSGFRVEYCPDETERKMYVTIYDRNNDPILVWCCEDKEATTIF